MNYIKELKGFATVFGKLTIRTIICLIILFLLSIFATAQTGEKIVTKYYTSFYDSANAQPTLVIYKLYKSPMKSICSRSGMTFHKDTICNVTASNKDYAGSGYDIGHMCDAEDMSFDCTAEESTFRFYNATPQSPANNRGTWKHYENFTRQCSQEDSILVLCGPILTDSGLKKIKDRSNLTVPNRDFKIVQSLSDPKVLYLMITVDQQGNDVTSHDETNPLTLKQLDSLVGFSLEKYLKN